ncbi:MAG: membrane lipoprotein lipid attachment site-containing protein [Pseudosphingobacterium sp.]|nr:membrane lipoprotein lipid attachment site-containing protein [Pseudosphingobacterium sp.]
MKRILFALTGVSLLSACSIYQQPAIYEASGIDYSKYSSNGFFISESNSVSFDYVPISSVSATVADGYVQKSIDGLQRKSNQKKDNVYSDKSPVNSERFSKGEYVEFTVSDAVELLYKRSTDLGANGIINLKIRRVSGYDKKGYWKGIGYEATGMAIKK